MKNEFARSTCAALMLPLLLVLAACGGPVAGGGGDKDTGGPEGPITPASADVAGRLIVPMGLLAEELEYDAVFQATRIWLFDEHNEPVANVEPDAVGNFVFEEVPADGSKYRIVAMISTADGAVTMETSIGELVPGEQSIYANITAETTVGAEIARDPELAAQYEARFEEATKAAYEEGVEPITASELSTGVFALVGFDETSLADGLPGAPAEDSLGTLASGFVKAKRCQWEGMLWWRKEVCSYTTIRIPDLVIKVPDPTASMFAPRLIPYTLPGTEIAKNVTAEERRVAMRINSDGLVEFFSNGIIAAGGGNIIAAGGGNIIATGGLNIIAAGGGNIIAAGGGNIISTGGGNIISTGGGNVLAPGQAALFEPQGGRYTGAFALVSDSLVKAVGNDARLAQFAAGQINAQQLMSQVSAGITSTSGGTARRIMSVGEPVTDPEVAKEVTKEPAPVVTQEQIDQFLQAWSPPRVHKTQAVRQSNGLELHKAPGGKVRIQASYVDANEMVAVWTGNWSGHYLATFGPYGTIDGDYLVDIPQEIQSHYGRLTILKLPASGNPQDATRYSNTETVVFDRPESFEVALLLDGETVVHPAVQDYYHTFTVDRSSAGLLFHEGKPVESVDLLFRFTNREMPVSAQSPDGVLSAFEVPSANLARFTDPHGGLGYLRLPLQADVIAAGSSPYVRLGSSGQHDRHVHINTRTVSIAPQLKVLGIAGFDANDYPQVKVEIAAGTDQLCDPILNFFTQPDPQSPDARGKTYSLCVQPGEQLETVLTFDSEPKLQPGTYYIALQGWFGNELVYSNYWEFVLDAPPSSGGGEAGESFVISGQVPDRLATDAMVSALYGETLVRSEIDANDQFEVALPATVESTSLQPFASFYDYPGCSNGITITPDTANYATADALYIEDAQAAMTAMVYLASRPFEDHASSQPGDKGSVFWVYVDSDVTVNGTRDCTADNGGHDHTFSADNVQLRTGWNALTTVLRSVDPYSDELVTDISGTTWFRYDFSQSQ